MYLKGHAVHHWETAERCSNYVRGTANLIITSGQEQDQVYHTLEASVDYNWVGQNGNRKSATG